MSLGPIIIFDKSTLQSLSIDESCWLDNFFLSNITPIFYVETLSNLAKEFNNHRSSEDMVSEISVKAPSQQSYPNVHHKTLLLGDLLGHKVDMTNKPVLGGGQTKQTTDGQVGIHFEQFPEAEILSRWQEGEFEQIEKDFAKSWRHALSNLRFDSMISLVKNIIPLEQKFRELSEIKQFLDDFVLGDYIEILYLTFQILEVPQELQNEIIRRWKIEKIPLAEFAPYASYVFKVDLFFYLSLAFNLISKERPSNKIDLSYLYYLPFCMIFVSSDKLHAKTAPLFMELGQDFIKGNDLKIALNQLDNYYSQLSDDVKSQGIMRFAYYPPLEIDNIVTQAWDKFCTIWRQHSEQRKNDAQTNHDKDLVNKIKKVQAESQNIPDNIDLDNADHVLFKRKVSFSKGKWNIFPPEVRS